MSGKVSRAAYLTLFAAAMGWLEAVVVIYLRDVAGLSHRGPLPGAGEIMSRLHSIPWLLPTEQTREAATMVMLATVAWLAGDGPRSRFGAFIAIFGIWDIAYYVGLWALIGWPTSLGAMDLLFLLPPHRWWYQPVGLPIVISLVMIAVGFWLFLESHSGNRRRAS